MESPAAPIDRVRLRPFVTNDDRSVYCLRHLPEEVVAVLFAYYSRSPDSLRANLSRLLAEGDLDVPAPRPGASLDEPAADEAGLAAARKKASAFHEKWVIGYGHSSVAEHAVVHVAVEDVSILASKQIEDCRLASYTEKSTRYVAFDTRRYHTPAVFAAGAAGTAYAAGIESLMTTYSAMMEPLTAHLVHSSTPREGQSSKGHLTACRAQACDMLRYLLPAATHTNLGMTLNARALEGMLVKLKSSPLPEARELAGAIQREAEQVVPTLLKYAERSSYRVETEQAMAARAAEILPRTAGGSEPDTGGEPSGVRLLRYDADAEVRAVEAILYAAGQSPAPQVAATASALAPAERMALIEDYLARRGRFDAPLRALEATSYLFEIVVDYGAYRDIQRHRMAGQYPQRLTTRLGYECPDQLEAAGLRSSFERAMESAARAWSVLTDEHPVEAQYVVPLAYRTRLLMHLNLRELHHFITLRSSRQGHRSYRRIAQQMHAAVAVVHPGLASLIRVDKEEYPFSRA